MVDFLKKIYLKFYITEKPTRIEVSTLPKHPSGFQRNYIDEVFRTDAINLTFLGESFCLTDASYGHTMNYPRGFKVCIMKVK